MLSENTNVHTNYSYTYRKLYIIYILFCAYMREECYYEHKISHYQDVNKYFSK